MTKPFTPTAIPRTLEGKILYFNTIYKLPVAPYPTLLSVVNKERTVPNMTAELCIEQRIRNFQKTLLDEIAEGTDIIYKLQEIANTQPGQEEPHTPLQILTDLSDWLHDIIIYCLSEAAKYGIPSMDVLDIIMSSNFSKLDADGNPIYDSYGKVLKGPKYWKPEPQIYALLKELIPHGVIRQL